ncbi:MAG: hypothetical protein HY244_13835 [Rhizobiales bacterium]|nr:hypothetical protein [Hyphomicrobiales bacterium]
MRNSSSTAEIAARKMLNSAPLHRLRTALGTTLAAVLAGWLALTPAGAETLLTEFNGRWIGSGTDRDSPLDDAQPTQCQTNVTADFTHMTSNMECNGSAGLHKRVHLSIAFSGNKFTGSTEQISVVRGSGDAPERHAGAVVGVRKDDRAEFEVKLPGLTPNAHVVLQLTSPTSFAMTISTLGSILTKVDFQRPVAPVQPQPIAPVQPRTNKR